MQHMMDPATHGLLAVVYDWGERCTVCVTALALMCAVHGVG
jgi:hypothetical protein